MITFKRYFYELLKSFFQYLQSNYLILRLFCIIIITHFHLKRIKSSCVLFINLICKSNRKPVERAQSSTTNSPQNDKKYYNQRNE